MHHRKQRVEIIMNINRQINKDIYRYFLPHRMTVKYYLHQNPKYEAQLYILNRSNLKVCYYNVLGSSGGSVIAELLKSALSWEGEERLGGGMGCGFPCNTCLFTSKDPGSHAAERAANNSAPVVMDFTSSCVNFLACLVFFLPRTTTNKKQKELSIGTGYRYKQMKSRNTTM